MDFKRMWSRSTVVNRLSSWYHGKNFDPRKLRGVVMGIVLTATIGEVACYRLVKQDIRAGELPNYVADLMIVVLSVFEVVIAPLISWWGYTKRKMLFIICSAASTLCFISWFFIPPKLEREESELCDVENSKNQTGFTGISTRAIVRLLIVVYSGIIFVVSRVASWSHGIAYSDEYAPDRTSVHYGTLLIGRIFGLVFGYNLMTDGVDGNIAIQILIFVIGSLVNLVQLPFVVPKGAPVVDGIQMIALPTEDRSLFSSVGRVLYNSVAMTQIFAMSLIAAALWGFGYYEIDIIKAKFNSIPERTFMYNMGDIFFYHFVAVVVAYAGTLFSAPLLMEFCKLKAIKQAVLMSVLVFAVYVIITVYPNCDKGTVAGLGNSYYNNPECSHSCDCKPQWEEFKPVCAVDNFVTYMSPCQAGCSVSQEIDGIQVFSNCTCAGGRVVERACTFALCQLALRMHTMLYNISITFAILVFQAQGVLVLRSVDPRDRAVAMGLAWSTVAIMAFVIGQLVFYGLYVSTCRWYEGDKCHVQSNSFPYLIGATCAFLAFTSVMTSVTSWIYIKMANKSKLETFDIS